MLYKIVDQLKERTKESNLNYESFETWPTIRLGGATDMAIKMKKADFEKQTWAFARFIDKWVKIEEETFKQGQLFLKEKEKKSYGLEYKLDVLEKMIELMRLRLRILDSEMDLDHFIQGEININPENLVYTPTKSYRKNKLGTPPIHLQPKLLIYLLYRYNSKEMKIYDIISKFMALIWNQTDILDFEKTKTGVRRCFTNTRFAANTLRDYGLLKFTKKEAYKTWTLSFSGIMVASKILKDGVWKKPLIMKDHSTDLHPTIRESFVHLKNRNEFIDTLTFVAKTNLHFLKDKPKGTQTTHKLLSQYHAILEDPEIPKKEKKNRCSTILEDLESDKHVNALFEELTSNFNIGDLIRLK